MEEIQDFTSLSQLGTTLGTVTLVTLITQYIKPELPEKFSIRLFVLLLCLIIQIGITALVEPSVPNIIVAIANSFVCATSAMGAYEVSFNKHGRG